MLADVEEGVSKRTMHQGYLKKWTNYIKNYQRRWFVYYKGILSYYKTRKDVGQVTQSQISMINAKLVISGDHSFKILKNKECIFSLKSENKDDFETWVDVLQNAINECHSFSTDSTSVKSERGSLISTASTYSFDEFFNRREKFLYDATNVKENCRQMTIYASEIQKIFQHLLVSTQGNFLGSEREMILNLTESIATFDQLNQKVKGTIEELARSSDLLAESAAATRASELENKITDSTSKAIVTNSEAEQSMVEASRIEDDINVSHNVQQENKQDEDSIFYDACENDSTYENRKDSQDVSSIEQQDSLSPTLTRSKRSSGSSSMISSRSLQHFRSSSDVHLNLTQKSLKNYRTSIPPRPDIKASLWTTLRHNIGKDLSKISIPVEFNDPISMLQRVTEGLEYSYLLDKAATCEDPALQMCYIAAFNVSNYCSTSYRTTKAFNPLLGETFEMDRSLDLGWRSICEQVSHHPPICSIHVEGNGWILYETFNIKSKFRAKYLLIEQLGFSQVIFTRTGFHYTWDKVSTTVNNIMIGSLWIDHFGTMHIENKSTGDLGAIEFIPCGFMSKSHPKKVTGSVKDKNNVLRYSINGFWDKYLECAKMMSGEGVLRDSMVSREMLFSAHPLQLGADKMYNFSVFTCSLNDFEPNIPSTDSRNRPDQRIMEAGNMDRANATKIELEDRQRHRTREALTQARQKGTANESTTYEDIYSPLWFKLDTLVTTDHKRPIYIYKGGYWEHKKNKDFSICPRIFDLD